MSSLENYQTDRHRSSQIKIESFRIIYQASSKSTQSSRDLDSFINHDFLNIRLKRSKDDLLDIILINRVLSAKESFIFQ